MENNYKKLYYNLNTGEYVTLDTSTEQSIYTRTFKQTTESNTWILAHNRGTRGIIIDVFNSNGEKITPESIDITDPNTCIITFASPQTGVASFASFYAELPVMLTATPTNTPTTSITPTFTPTPTISNTPSNTVTPTLTVTPTTAQTATPTVTATPSVTATITPTVTVTPTQTVTLTPTPTTTPTLTITPTVTVTPSAISFDPLGLFGDGKGFWLKPRDRTTLYQSSSETGAVTSNTDPIGFIQDQSGHGLHFHQTVNGNRPISNTTDGKICVDFDSSSKFIKNASAHSGFLSTTMDAFVLIRFTKSTDCVTFHTVPSGITFYSYYDAVSSTATYPAGANAQSTYKINGNLVTNSPNTTAQQLQDAITPYLNQWIILEIYGITAGSYSEHYISGYEAAYAFNGQLQEYIWCSEKDDSTRTQVREYLADIAGITL